MLSAVYLHPRGHIVRLVPTVLRNFFCNCQLPPVHAAATTYTHRIIFIRHPYPVRPLTRRDR